MNSGNNKGDGMKKLTHHQAHIIYLLKDLDAKGYYLTPAGANISFKPQAMAALIKKGIVREVTRSRLREDDREMVYWKVYELVPSKLEIELT